MVIVGARRFGDIFGTRLCAHRAYRSGMRVTHNKLVRDHIPEIIEADGHHAVTRILHGPDYQAALLAKLVEEAVEAQTASADELPSELTDVWEVLQALLSTLPMTWQELDALAASKRGKRGGFKDRIFLEYTEQAIGNCRPSGRGLAADQAASVRADRVWLAGRDQPGYGCGGCRWIRQLLDKGHAAHVVLDRSGLGDDEFAGEIAAGNGAELAGEEVLALIQAQPLPVLWRPAGKVAERRSDQIVELPQVPRTIEHDSDAATGPGDPAQLAYRCRWLGDVVEHVRPESEVADIITEREGGDIASSQERCRRAASGGSQHSGGEVYARYRPDVATQGQFCQIRAVAAPYVDDGLAAAQIRKVEHQWRQRHYRALKTIKGLPGGQVAVRAVLNFAQPGAAGPREILVTSHQQHRN